MRISTRLVVAGLMSVLALGIVPAAVATATATPSMAVRLLPLKCSVRLGLT